MPPAQVMGDFYKYVRSSYGMHIFVTCEGYKVQSWRSYFLAGVFGVFVFVDFVVRIFRIPCL